jgi:membrane protease YdiL (CAAX protease family)
MLLLGVAVLLLSYARRKLLRGSLSKADLFPLKPLPWVVYPVLTGLLLCTGFWTEPLGRLLPMPASMQQAMLALIHQSDYIPLVVAMFILTALMELLCTGIVLNGLLQKYAPAPAIFCSSLCFALTPLNPWAFPVLFLVGIGNGWLFYKTRSLSPVLYTRAIMGLMSIIWAGLTTSRTASLYDFSDLSWRGILDNDPLYYGIVTGSLLITMLLLGWLERNLTSLIQTR